MADEGAQDQRIRHRPVERHALLTHDVQAFCLTSGNLVLAEMAARFLSVRESIERACLTPGPFLYAVSRQGLRRIPLDD